MQVVTGEFVKGKKVILRYDLDVALRSDQGKPFDPERSRGTQGKLIVAEDFKLRAGLETLKLCLENASKVIIIGHLGRPFETAEDEKQGNPEELSAQPVKDWLEKTLGQSVEFAKTLEQANASLNKLILLENVRFFHGEIPGAVYHSSCTSKTCDIDFARQLASLGEVYVNEAFSSYNEGASTTMVPALLPHAAGLHFAREVKVLGEVRDNPKKPLVVIMGGAKVADKLPVIEEMAKRADAVLVGGKIAGEFSNPEGDPSSLIAPQDDNSRLEIVGKLSNVLVGKLNEAGEDIAPETTESWRNLIMQAKMIVWNGPLGKFEDPKNNQSAKIARMVLESGAQIVVGGGDTVSLLGSLGILGKYEKAGFVSVGGGAMLKFLADGTLPTIEALR